MNNGYWPPVQCALLLFTGVEPHHSNTHGSPIQNPWPVTPCHEDIAICFDPF